MEPNTNQQNFGSIPDFSPEEPSFGEKFKNGFIELIEFIAIIGAIFVILRFFIAEPHKVSGNSMFPNFHDGDYIITNKITLRLSDLKRGEVIILQNPRNQDQVFIKRIIGLPLEHVKVFDGQVYVNGVILNEAYLSSELQTPAGAFLSEGEEIVVPEGQYFVMGDNRTASSDSREWGPIKKELIIGQAWFRYWPVQSLQLIQVAASSS